MAVWRARRLSYADVQEEYRHLNETRPVTFIFHIRGGVVSIEDAPPGRPKLEDTAHRAELYRRFIQEVVTSYSLDVDTSFALEPSDQGHRSDKAPIFVFQKQAASDAVLFPDIDFLGSKFYVGEECEDKFSFNQKSASAMFVGSTSGAVYDEKMVRTLASPRLRAAEYFKHSPEVRFLLPVITQCDTKATADLLREMGYGSGEFVPWKVQMMNKFIISMDGNGATCSRVAVALKSNSALLKYNSPHLLYYFSHLIPWRHYIPIEADSDIDGIVRMERAEPGLFRYVADEGRRFAEHYLTKPAVSQYVAELIRCYAATFPSAAASVPVSAPHSLLHEAIGSVSFECMGHIQDRGDVWVSGGAWLGEAGSERSIEGIALLWTANLGNMSYRVIGQDGTLSEPGRCGEFRGARGCNTPIAGFCIDLEPDTAEYLTCCYSATFIDGSKVGPVSAGQPCQSGDLAPLESLQIEIFRRVNDRHQGG
jgi:hypothetical protein